MRAAAKKEVEARKCGFFLEENAPPKPEIPSLCASFIMALGEHKTRSKA
jgi:hypothetical protein